MPLITLEIPHKKMQHVKAFMEKTGLRARRLVAAAGEGQRQQQYNRHNLPTSFTNPTRGWEFFRNELEFE